MSQARVVPAFHSGNDSQARFGLEQEVLSTDQLALHTSKGALGHRVVVGISDRARQEAHAHFPAPLAEDQ